MTYDLLAGTRVVELAMYAFGPSAAAVLADWGADVVKIVPPHTGDPMRGNPVAGLPDKDVGVAFMWEQFNRGKRCVGLDVSTGDGQEVLADLVRGADVFLTNLLPGARSRFRVDVEDMLALNPGLVYARASGHGDRGPERDAGGFDHTDFWARTGIAHAASQVSDEFVPQAGPALGDVTAGAFLAGGVAAALVRKARTGRGAVVDVSLLSSGIWAFAPAVLASRLYGVDTIPRMRHADLPNPLVAAYTTQDGRQVYLSGVQTDKHFANLCEVVGHPELLDDPRWATGAARLQNARECITALDEIFARRDLAEWVVRLRDLATPWTLVQTAAEAAADPQVVANGYVVGVPGPAGEYRLVASPAQFDGAAPALAPAPEHGEHTEEVLLGTGRDWAEIARLKDTRTVN
jgi:crotonobetainyl-CoA:carnitine CoA-transferase CaiB-like acyl-CoA transferase